MRELLRRVLGGAARPAPRRLSAISVRRPTGSIRPGRAAPYPRLRPSQVRGWQFTVRRRGLDPGEVAAFLDRVADELARTYTELACSREEAARIKDALRRWQSRHAASVCDLVPAAGPALRGGRR